MKRFTSLLLCVILLFSLLSLPVFADAVNGTLSSVNIAPAAGETFSLPLYLSDNASLNAFRLFVEYDPALLTFSGVTEDGIFAGIETMTVMAGKIALVWNDADPVTENGLVCHLSFTLSSGADAGTSTSVTVSGDEEDGWCLDGDLEPYVFAPVTAGILVPYPCDIAFDANGFTRDVEIGSNVSDVVSELENGGYPDVKIFGSDGEEKAWNETVGSGDEIRTGGNSFYIVIPGDINGDGRRSVTDYVILRAELLTPGELDGVRFAAADLNASAHVSVTDYVLLRTYLLSQN